MSVISSLLDTLFAQQARPLELKTALPDASLIVERFNGREAISESFRFEHDQSASAGDEASYARRQLILFDRDTELPDGRQPTICFHCNNAAEASDTLYEEFMAFGIAPETRFETDHLCQVRPYGNLFYALTEEGLPAQLKEPGLFLKRWYKDLAGTGWHDSHIEQAGYYGYWSFEAGAAVRLLGIEDDSSLHKYLYYPKHLVAWAKENAGRFPDGGMTATTSKRPNVAAGAPCPESGWWFTPAKANSRQYFEQGASMLSVGGDYGLTFWQ